MGFFSLKTKEQLEEERRRRQRLQRRGIDNAIETLREGHRKAAKEQEDCYQQGKALLKAGRDSEARIYFQSSRQQGAVAMNCMRQSLIWENALVQIRIAGSTQAAAGYFKELAAECGLNAEAFASGFASLEDVESTIGEMNRGMERKWAKDSARAGQSSEAEADAGLQEMMERARREVAAENGLAMPGEASAAAPGAAVPGATATGYGA